ncbi:hypothetical protein LINPERHAP2_LOCUS16050 [Linum perenne]
MKGFYLWDICSHLWDNTVVSVAGVGASILYGLWIGRSRINSCGLALPIYHIEPRDLEPFCRVWEMKVGQSWSKSWLRLWEKLVKEARATRKDENWIRSSNPRGITLNDWTIYMSYMYGEEFQISKAGVKPSRGQLYIKFYKLDKGDEKDRKLVVNIFNY